jgi:Na+-translocating ferredoxin:NAD+ oxidoreductase RnfG subunit
MKSALTWLPTAAIVIVAPAYAGQYATVDEAAKRAFPDATSFKESVFQLSADEIRNVATATGLPVKPVLWRSLLAMNGDKPLGVLVLDGVIGKFELIDYAVGIGNDGKIRNVEILAYRESHGYEVRLPAWRKQFVGKDKASRLRVSEDIASISGATMSATHITDGVRRIVAVIDQMKAAGKF